MRAARCIFTGLALLTACTGEHLSSASGDLAATPAAVEFPTTWIGHPTTRTVSLHNGARATKRVFLTLEAPFTAARAIDLRGGELVHLEVTFAPDVEGTFDVALRIDSTDDEHLEVRLSGASRVPPACSDRACFSSRFDPESGTCVEEREPDGTSCEAACLERATCLAGTCIGTPATCDDNNACTADACDPTSGCIHVDVSSQCAAPTEPCRASLCDPATGCTTVTAPDGTACGPSDCTAANVCNNGACVVVEPPDGTACGERTPCRDRGRCVNRTCELPPERALTPAWSLETGLEARNVIFPGVADRQGNLYWIEVVTSDEAVLVSVTSAGLPRFRVGIPGDVYPLRDAVQGRLLIAGEMAIVALGGPHVAGIRTTDGALAWNHDLRVTLATDPNEGLFAGPIVLDGDGRPVVRVLGNQTPAALLTVSPESGEILETRDGPLDLLPLVGDSGTRTFRLDARREDYALVAMDGASEPWNIATAFHAAATTSGVLVGFVDGWTIAARSTEDGQELWRLPLAHPLEYEKWTPVASEVGFAYATTPDSSGLPNLATTRMIAFDPATGAVRRTTAFPAGTRPGTAPLLTTRDTALFGTNTPTNARLWEVGASTGTRSSCAAPGTAWEPFSILVDERWITSTADGRIVAYDTPGLSLARTGWASPGGNAQRTGRAR